MSINNLKFFSPCFSYFSRAFFLTLLDYENQKNLQRLLKDKRGNFGISKCIYYKTNNLME